jgi:hypothetical protein
MALHLKHLLRSLMVLYGNFHGLYLTLREIIMAHLWLSLIGIIWDTIWYCNSCSYRDIILYYIAYYICLCCIVHCIIVESHELGSHSFDTIYYFWENPLLL